MSGLPAAAGHPPRRAQRPNKPNNNTDTETSRTTTSTSNDNNNSDRPLSVYDNLTTIEQTSAQPNRFTYDIMPVSAAAPTVSRNNSSVRVTDIDVDPTPPTPPLPLNNSLTSSQSSQTPHQQQQQQQRQQQHYDDHYNNHQQLLQQQRQQQQQQLAQLTTRLTPVETTTTAATSSTLAADEAAGQSSSAAQYENVVETIKLRNSFRQQQNQQNVAASASSKPVISDAKSSFFGLSTTAASPTDKAPLPQDTQTTAQPLYSMPHRNQQRLQPPAAAAAPDRSPLIDDLDGGVPTIVPTAAKSNGEYQNIPSNSAMFQQQQQQAMSEDFGGQNGRYHPHHQQTTNNYGDSPSSPQSAAQQGASETGGGKHFMLEANRRISEQHTPSQAVYMSTTVPQNLKGSNIAGRHTPTRTSLRHSRMIVVNKNYQAPRRPNPLNLTHPLLAKLLLSVQLCCGIMITCLSVWVLLWAPNTRTRDNPYWSGLMLILAAVLALCLVQFRRQPRHKLREHCYTFLRVNSTTISMLAVVVSFAAFLFATLHLDNVTSAQTVCMPADVFSSSNAVCICLFGNSAAAAAAAGGNGSTSTSAAAVVRPSAEGGLTADGLEFQYRDLSCTEVRGAWKYILFAFTLLNMIAFIVSCLYLMMLCCPRGGHKHRHRSPNGGGENGSGAAASTAVYAPVRSAL